MLIEQEVRFVLIYREKKVRLWRHFTYRVFNTCIRERHLNKNDLFARTLELNKEDKS